MKISIIIYTFGGDAHCLGPCLTALHRLQASGHRLRIHIADDTAHPLPYPPAGCTYWQTAYDRRGNLNGRICVQGQLALMAEIAAEDRPDFILKLDCDTVVLGLGWISPDTAMSGFLLAPDKDYCSGMCYAVRAADIPAMHAWAQANGHLLAHNVPEDIGMGIACRAVGGDATLHQVYEEGKRACGYIYNGTPDESGDVIERPDWAAYAAMEVLTFGNRNYIHPSIAEPRRYAATVMQAFVAWQADKTYSDSGPSS